MLRSGTGSSPSSPRRVRDRGAPAEPPGEKATGQVRSRRCRGRCLGGAVGRSVGPAQDRGCGRGDDPGLPRGENDGDPGPDPGDERPARAGRDRPRGAAGVDARAWWVRARSDLRLSPSWHDHRSIERDEVRASIPCPKERGSHRRSADARSGAPRPDGRACPALVALYGTGPDTAGALLLAAGDNPERLRSEAAFAKLCGVSPVEASSGMTTRHRLSRAGDRRANSALWRIVMVRLRQRHQPTVAYVARRTAEGKSKREIIRCLKRYVAREVYRALTEVHADPSSAA